MACSTCQTCGGTLHWEWAEAFLMLGFCSGQIETWTVKEALEAEGYQVITKIWDCYHNVVISSITMDGVELIRHDDPAYALGRGDPRQYLPDDLIKRLDELFPPIDGHQINH